MSKAIVCLSIGLMFLYVSIYPADTLAQVAPTNSATISGSVSDSTGKPVANAKVSLSGLKTTSTQTDTQGLFVFVGVPFGTYQISAAAAGLGTATRSVSVQGDTNVAIRYERVSQNGLKVIAQVSSIANAQFNVTPASITQVNPIADAFEGRTSWRTILEQIPGVAQAGLQNGYNNPEASIPDSPLVSVQLAINGTLPYETAILLDDMPLIGGSATTQTGAGTDLAVYPLNGFGSADVVRGPGANAPSIVDSIGGSFVLHSPGIVNNNRYEFSLSTDPYGGIVANTTVAVRSKKLSLTFAYGINDSPGPMINGGRGFLTGGFFFPLAVNGQSFTAYVPPCSQPCQGGILRNSNYSSGGFDAVYGFQTGLLMCCIDKTSAWTQHGGSLALHYAFSQRTSADIFYAGQIENMVIPSANAQVNFLPQAGYTGSVPSGMNVLPFVLTSYGLPLQQASSLFEEKITTQLGLGTLHLSALQNRTFGSYVGTRPSSLMVQLFGSGTLGGTPTNFNGGTYTANCVPFQESSSTTNNDRDLLLSYLTPLGDNFHIGTSFVKSFYNMPSQFVYQYGAPYNFIGSTLVPSAISQTTNEFRVFAGGMLLAKTSLDLSMYFANANYHVQNPDDLTGNTYVDERYSYAAPRLGFVWRPSASIAVRAAAGGGFAEAPLNDLVGSNAPFCFGSTCSVTLPNLNLQPEKSFGFDFGTDIRLHHNTVLSFDVYRSNLYGQLYQSTSTNGSCPICSGLPLFVTQYNNLGESRYEGVLFDLRHDTPVGAYWSLSGGLTRGYVVSVPAGFYNGTTGFPATPCMNCTNLYVVPGINFNGSFAASIPYAQGLGVVGYRWSSEKYIDLTGTYYGNNNTYFRPAFVEFDGRIGYPLSKNISLLGTFRNLTGIYDGVVQVYSPENLSGAPTISGPAAPLYGEMYGPRTFIMTLQAHL